MELWRFERASLSKTLSSGRPYSVVVRSSSSNRSTGERVATERFNLRCIITSMPPCGDGRMEGEVRCGAGAWASGVISRMCGGLFSGLKGLTEDSSLRRALVAWKQRLSGPNLRPESKVGQGRYCSPRRRSLHIEWFTLSNAGRIGVGISAMHVAEYLALPSRRRGAGVGDHGGKGQAACPQPGPVRQDGYVVPSKVELGRGR